MRFYEVTEARKNPEQNPKTSINQIIADRLADTTDLISSIPNLFVSFTTIDKLGINPSSKYDTPLGIYAYPANYVVSRVGRDMPMIRLPFAGNSPWANIFKATGNIINLESMTGAEEQEQYNAIMDYLRSSANSMPSKKTETISEKMPEIIDDARLKATFSDYPGGRFWYVTMLIAQLVNSDSPAVAWNKLFRSIGIDGVIDTGVGIIHNSEPTQAVFFSINAIAANERVANKYSPTSIITSTTQGADDKIVANWNRNKHVTGKTPEELVKYVLDNKLEHILPTIKNQGARLAILHSSPASIKYLKKPTEAEQYAALSGNDGLMQALPHLSKTAHRGYDVSQNALVKLLGTNPSIESADLISKCMLDPSPLLQVTIAKILPQAVMGFTNPTNQAIRVAHRTSKSAGSRAVAAKLERFAATHGTPL